MKNITRHIWQTGVTQPDHPYILEVEQIGNVFGFTVLQGIGDLQPREVLGDAVNQLTVNISTNNVILTTVSGAQIPNIEVIKLTLLNYSENVYMFYEPAENRYIGFDTPFVNIVAANVGSMLDVGFKDITEFFEAVYTDSEHILTTDSGAILLSKADKPIDN